MILLCAAQSCSVDVYLISVGDDTGGITAETADIAVCGQTPGTAGINGDIYGAGLTVYNRSGCIGDITGYISAEG